MLSLFLVAMCGDGCAKPLYNHLVRKMLAELSVCIMTKDCYNATMTIQEILDAAQALPSGERARLIHASWDTISPDDWTLPTEGWIAEYHKRSNELDACRMTSSPGSEVQDRARREAGHDSS